MGGSDALGVTGTDDAGMSSCPLSGMGWSSVMRAERISRVLEEKDGGVWDLLLPTKGKMSGSSSIEGAFIPVQGILVGGIL